MAQAAGADGASRMVGSSRVIEIVGASPSCGAALCDRLCFPREKAQADALRSALLQARREQFTREGRTEVHVSNGNLPWWWLLFCASICVPFQVTFGILSLVLVPANVKTLVGDEHKAKYLGSKFPCQRSVRHTRAGERLCA